MMRNRDKLKNLINESRILKLPESMTARLVKLNEQVTWQDECDRLWFKVSQQRAEYWSSSDSSHHSSDDKKV